MPTDEDRAKSRAYYARKRQNPEWLADYRRRSNESAMRFYWRNKDKPRTPEQEASRKKAQREWYERSREAPDYRERTNDAARRFRAAHKKDLEWREAQRAYAREFAKKRKLVLSPEEKARRREVHRLKQRAKRASLTPEQQAIRSQKKREWARADRAKNPDKVRAKDRAAREANPEIKIARNLRARLWQAVRGKAKKAAPTMDLVGCSPAALRLHLESLFLPGMSWANYNHKGWHVDHIKPCASFDLTDPAQQRACFHYSNLQPLWAADNQRKYAK